MQRWILFLLVILMSHSASSANWEVARAESEIFVTTSDKNGSERETTIWIVVVDGEAFVRTSGTPWERSIKRNPHAVLTIAGGDYPVQIRRVRDRELIKRVQTQFRAKYGGTADRMARVVRLLFGGSHIYRVAQS
jgi:hypothetical protein